MSNAKKPCSEASSEYIQNQVPISDIDKKRYERSKRKEAMFNENWVKQKMNLNGIPSRNQSKTHFKIKRPEEM